MAKTESSSWPFFRIQLMGTLPGTVASKRYGARIWKSIPLVLLVGGFLGFSGTPSYKLQVAPWIGPISVLLVAVWASFIVRSFLTMLRDSDELELRIHLEAIAIVFVGGVASSIVAGVASYWYGWTINPGWFYLLELLRGVMVGLKARQFAS